jgi:hypothetical protein
VSVGVLLEMLGEVELLLAKLALELQFILMNYHVPLEREFGRKYFLAVPLVAPESILDVFSHALLW